jgi:hypothetical protein
MPKTGGTFVATALRQVLPPGDALYADAFSRPADLEFKTKDQHQPVSEIPTRYRDRPVACTIRNPFDHLVSFFEFGWWKDHPGDTFAEDRSRARYNHYPELSFQEYLESVYDWRLLDPRYVEPDVARALQARDLGPLTLDYIRFLSDRPAEVIGNLDCFLNDARWFHELSDIHFIRMEDLNRELYRFLVSMNYPPTLCEPLLRLGRVYPDRNRRRRTTSKWESYYTPRLKDLVRRKERQLFSVFPEYDL